MNYTSYELNAVNKFPDLPPKQAIAEYKKLTGKGGRAGAGKPKPWATFADPERARLAQIKSTESKLNKSN